MKLTYRGIEYDYNPPRLEVTDSEISCQYRGHAARYSYVRHVPIPQPAERLTYRGVAYQTTRQGEIQQITPQTTTEQTITGTSPALLTSLRSQVSQQQPGCSSPPRTAA